MTLQVLFEPEAVNELREARRWYDDVRPGLGGDLLAEVEMSIEHALRWPELAPRLLVPESARQVRRAPLRRFPFGIVYVVIDESVVGARHRPRSTPASLLARSPTVSDAQPVLLDEPAQTGAGTAFSREHQSRVRLFQGKMGTKPWYVDGP